jgi:hypothetical protein
MKSLLTAEYSEEEVHRALMQMETLKALGPNGFLVGFYQQQWSIVHSKVCSDVLHFVNGSKMKENINVTHIALIPPQKKSLVVSLISGPLAFAM